MVHLVSKKQKDFNDKSTSLDHVCNLICTRLGWWLKAKYPDLNFPILHFLTNIQELSISVTQKSIKQEILWSLPLGIWKLNVDGLAMGNPRLDGIGGLIRDSKEQVLFVFSKSIEIANLNFAELMTVVDALSYVASVNFDLLSDIILKSDSKAVISWLNNVLDSP